MDVARITDVGIVARTLWGEARGEGREGMLAVACVILNRANSETTTWWGTNVRSVCLKRYQFSCWNFGDPNRAKLLEVSNGDPAFTEALDIAADAIMGNIDDITNGANSYFDKRMANPPVWSEGEMPTAVIGNHQFYKL